MLRLLLWLMIALLPLLGFAAAAPLCCGTRHHEPAHSPVQSPQHGVHPKGPTAPMDMAATARAGADAGTSASAASADGCGVCASLCHAFAMPYAGPCTVAEAVPDAFLPQVLLVISSRTPPVADRPPRA